ncbi:MAG: endonuclease domain-containing protein [Xanthomonadales bacterium]|nr:endonuclease domain-containing protein [Xanthomonadales bacterium]MCB1642278.1 endonuclease domain-containing protein [Xanthomonadales bacterium]
MSVAIEPRRVRQFRFVDARWQDGQATLRYAVDALELTETIDFPGAPTLSPARQAAFDRALAMLHWLAGTSYYKAVAGAGPSIVFEQRSPEADEQTLVDAVYRHGLAEFAHVNGLDLDSLLHWPDVAVGVPSLVAGQGTAESKDGGQSPIESSYAAKPLGLPRRALLPLGGGKDSLVSADLLLQRDEHFALTWVGSSELIAQCAARISRPSLNIRRRIAPELIELNRLGAWNGHVPVTAINSAILVLAALLYGFDEIVFSNEASAGVPTLIEADGRPVNHQWSKGPAFEQAFAAWIRQRVAADLHYYSLLRPLSELAVTRRFARLERYFDEFSSCNRNFRLSGDRPQSRWCGECPKCHFVFLALAPFLAKPALTRIFGRNLLDDPAQIGGFEALLEWQAHKPFECVGEARESRAAMARLADRADWREDVVVAHARRHILPQLPLADLALAPLLEPGDDAGLPERLRGAWLEPEATAR